MPICADCEVKPEDTFFCRKRVRVLLFSSRVRRVYFGGGYFHHRKPSSKLRRFGACFSTLCCACFHSGDKPPQWRKNFACKSGCNGGKVRCNCAVRCVDLRTDSTPVLLSWIVLVWLSPPILVEQRSVSHRFLPKKNKKSHRQGSPHF